MNKVLSLLFLSFASLYADKMQPRNTRLVDVWHVKFGGGAVADYFLYEYPESVYPGIMLHYKIVEVTNYGDSHLVVKGPINAEVVEIINKAFGESETKEYKVIFGRLELDVKQGILFGILKNKQKVKIGEIVKRDYRFKTETMAFV